MGKTKVLCGAPCGKTPVFHDFYDSLARLEVPPGSKKIRVNGGSVPLNLNKLVDEAVNTGCSHLFVVEDDSAFAADTVMRLLKHDKPVVAGLCRSRQAPFRPYIYSGLDGPDGKDGILWYNLGQQDKGLIKVAATGMGGILINTEVFKKLKRPYFQCYFDGEKEWGQDIHFAKELIKAGIDVYCDLDITIWHATQCVLGTERTPAGMWKIVVKVNEGEFKVQQQY